MGSTSEAMKKAIEKYQAKFDLISFRVPKGKKDEIIAYALSHEESLTKFITRLIDEEMKTKP